MGEATNLAQIRKSLARAELTAIESTISVYGTTIRAILDMDDPAEAAPVLDWLAKYAEWGVANLQERLDRAQDILAGEAEA